MSIHTVLLDHKQIFQIQKALDLCKKNYTVAYPELRDLWRLRCHIPSECPYRIDENSFNLVALAKWTDWPEGVLS